ncbi:RagB/SusD family nutrient uptake outer membrane protein [Rhodocytophaga rosea]|uniref:RagB/SusD family nutrient uptake outer membrane protein n=1 Tax=Rhodocytophaga rosea TaxID=2704465 RepID=A0A6C0GC07_9BACT|nr:RagB/SusD family nutrient uptake outer membrane protein [Rhodocytophaga rosea]QHT65509.1 RagB/SusD family nutrient uptake outer membrane protein [Rhodocytophaga rosea]
MKNIIKSKIKSLLMVPIAIVGLSCSDLEEKPDFINPGTFYKSARELQTGVNAIYDDLGMGNGDWFNYFYNRYVFECLVGYQVGWEKGPLQYNLGNVNPADEYIEPYWGQSYRAINRANAIIETAETMNDPGNVDLVKRLKAEAQFLRAFYYYGLLSYFDNAPVTVKSTKGIGEFPTNSGGKRALIDQIYADAIAAAEVLPASYSGADAGRATKWAAKAILMKAQLWDQKWTDAKATAEDIVNNSGLSLFTDFSHNFDIAHENQGERIFEAQISAAANASEYNNHSAHFNPEDYPSELGGAGWSWLSATQDFRASYDNNDKRIDASFIEEYPTGRLGKVNGQYPVVHWSPNADYNLSRFGGIVRTDANPNDPNQLIFGKAWSGKLVELGINYNNTERNTVYIRLADILLGHSEASNESGQGDAYMGINMVRARAGLAPLSGLSQQALRDAIVKERMQEFVFEQVMYPELRRKSTFGGQPDYLGDQIRHYSTKYNVGRVPKKQDYVLPIPLKEIQGNSNVQQNPEWQ